MADTGQRLGARTHSYEPAFSSDRRQAWGGLAQASKRSVLDGKIDVIDTLIWKQAAMLCTRG